MRIAIDAMGGDLAPAQVIDATLDRASKDPAHTYILVGPEDRIREELSRRGAAPECVKVHHAPETIGMNEHPVHALREKPDNTILGCIRLALAGEADAILSGGNTGAVVAAAILKLGLLEGVKRAGILVPIPTERGMSGLIDGGANLKCYPINFLHYAVMASTYFRLATGQAEEATVGLINVGEEAEKGTELYQQTNLLFKRFLESRFVGNVEGHEIFAGKAQVMVCDGFVGNVIIKAGEGIIQTFGKTLLSNGMHESVRGEVHRAMQRFDYATYGGAPLLGVNGVVIIAHGRSDARALARAIEAALEVAQKDLLAKLRHELGQLTLWRRFQKWFEEKWFEGKE